MRSLKFFCCFGSRISRYDEKAFKAESLILLFSCLKPLWNKTNRSFELSAKRSGQKGRNVSKTLKPGRIPFPLGSLKSSQRLVLN